MLPSFKNADGTTTKVQSKREQKKGINIRWNSRLYFQLSLIATMLLAFVIIESDISLGSGYEATPREIAYLAEPSITEYEVFKEKIIKVEKPQEIKKRVIQKKITDIFNVKEDTDNVIETKTDPTNVDPDVPSTPIEPKKEAALMPEPASNIFQVDEIPAFPGCEGFTNREERLACFSSKIHAFIGRKFDTGVMPDGLAGKRQRINVQFTVNSSGNVTNIKTVGPRKELEQEARRVISKLPKMKPAKKANKNVDMIYQIPIVVQTDE